MNKPTSEIGNAAAMRAALEFAENELWALGAFDSSKRVAAALAAPPRNCDVGTAEEQAKRFEIFCQAHHEPWKIGMIKNECKCPCLQDNGRSCNYFVWAQMPYEEGGAE